MADVTVVKTNYPHPTVTTGQHNNGPGVVWVRVGETWYNTGCSSLLRVRDEIAHYGTSQIEAGEKIP